MSPLTEPTKIILRNGWQPMDPDAAAYITAVETADGQALEEKVKIAIDNFVLGCKADGIWSAIKASCILAGARTLSGALVPLAGTAPTNFNFVSGDYNRKTGLVGDGSTKYLNSNRNNNADPQNSQHLAVYASTAGAFGTQMYIGAGGSTGAAGATHFNIAGANMAIRNRNSTTFQVTGLGNKSGLLGINRASASLHSFLFGGQSGSFTQSSQSPFNGDVQVFANEATRHTNARLAFYSIGESLDLALLDARVTDLINKFAEVIP